MLVVLYFLALIVEYQLAIVFLRQEDTLANFLGLFFVVLFIYTGFAGAYHLVRRFIDE